MVSTAWSGLRYDIMYPSTPTKKKSQPGKQKFYNENTNVAHMQGGYKGPAERYRSDDLVSFPASWLLECEIFARMWLRWVLVLAYIGVGIFFLVEIAESVVHLPMLALICTN